MLPLVVRVQSPDGQVRQYAFAESPVTIGRSPLAELQLVEPFVSRWEGTLRFSEQQITYFSLGGTNPTYADGRLLTEHEDVVIGPSTVLVLGELRLTFAREHVPASDLREKGKARPASQQRDTESKTVFLEVKGIDLPRSPRTSPPPEAAPNPPLQTSAPSGSPAWHGGEGPQSAPPREPWAGPASTAGVRVLGGMRLTGTHAVPVGRSDSQEVPRTRRFVGEASLSDPHASAAAHSPLPAHRSRHESQVNDTSASQSAKFEWLHDDYRESWRRLFDQVKARLDSLAPHTRHEYAAELARRYPQILEEPDYQALLRSYGIASGKSQTPEVREWLQSVARDVLPDNVPFDASTTLQRVFSLLDTLTQSLAELNDAQESVRRRWLGRAPRASVLRSDNGRAILAYLLNPRANWEARQTELEQTVREAVTHQLALLKATMEGSRFLLGSISPHAVAQAEGLELDPEGDAAARAGLLDRWRGSAGTEARLWRRYLSMYETLLDSDRYQRVFMGRAFARTYLMAMGQKTDAEG